MRPVVITWVTITTRRSTLAGQGRPGPNPEFGRGGEQSPDYLNILTHADEASTELLTVVEVGEEAWFVMR